MLSSAVFDHSMSCSPMGPLDYGIVATIPTALFFLGKYLEIEEGHSRIEPLTDGVSVRYLGELEATRVLARSLNNRSISSQPLASSKRTLRRKSYAAQ